MLDSQGHDILYAASFEGAIYMWDMKSGNYLGGLVGHQGTVTSLDVDVKQKILASSSSDRTAILWDVEARKPRMVLGKVGNNDENIGHTGQVTSVALCRRKKGDGSDDELIVCTTGFDTKCRIWNGETGVCERVLSGHLSGVWSACFIGPSIVVTASGDATIRIWAIDFGRCVKIITGHSDNVYRIHYSNEKRTLYSTSADRTLREWVI